MSWDPYVDTLVEAGFHHACIAGHDGHVWGSTPDFKVQNAEIIRLVSVLLDDPEAIRAAYKSGFTLCVMPYALNRLDEAEDDLRMLVGRCKKAGKPARGAIVAKTAKSIIIGIHDPVYSDGKSFGRAKVAVFQLAETLIAMNF
ncbi:Profilin-2 [Gracilariopsis chorda]|uniref:Profilin n=1 Tax=Gracilariopsis chorda TaxID=448386 RepID=A0A2V3IVN0_9FLOR|nr:Profilin-2 [Gracilariopsis chorda]|eukprot:PXF46143.1 Profilin-2 [Gracilariopsis chorda]